MSQNDQPKEPAPPEAEADADDAAGDEGDEQEETLWQQALRKVGLRRDRAIPFIQQLSLSECGLASLAMVLATHGKEVRLEELRTLVQVEMSGVTAQAILETARHYKLRARGVSLEMEGLQYLPRASILHWGFNHFVVFEKLERNSVVIVDPGRGRRKVPMDEMKRSFTGVALLFEPSEEFEPGAGRGRVYKYLLEVLRGSGLWTRLLMLSVLLQVLALALPLFTGAVVDRVIPRGDMNLLSLLAVGLVTLTGFHLVSSLVRGHLLVHLRVAVDARMRLSLLERLVELPYSFFQLRSSGDLMNRMNSVDHIVGSLTSATLSTVLDGAMVLLYLVLLTVLSPALGALVLVLGVVQVSVFFASSRKMKELAAQDLEVHANASSALTDLLIGIETVKAMGEAKRMLQNWVDHFSRSLNAIIRRGSAQALLNSLMGGLRLGAPVLVLVLGAREVLQGRLGLGEMLALNALASGFLLPLSNLVETALELRSLTSHAERLDDIQNTPRERDQASVLATPRLSGRLELERVSFRYGPLSPLVVKEASLQIEPGQFVALVGRSGSGKSTLAMLMLGLVQPSEGRVLYDGVDLATLDLDSVRRQLGVVPQRAYLFRLSVRENITLLDREIAFEKVIEAAKRARIHEEILALPLGYDTPVAEGGSSMSGGQRQRIALARAMVREPKILLLDEATSALDAITEREVQKELADLRCTRIVVAHRLSTVVDADLILVVDQGRIIEGGTHHELLARRGAYAALVASQMERSEKTVKVSMQGLRP